MADLLPDGALLNSDEADVIDRALFVAIYHRRPSAEAEPSVARCRDVFDELRRVRGTNLSPVPDSAPTGIRLRRGRVQRVLILGTAWSTACSALLLACFDDNMCEHDFPTIVGLPRSDFHVLAADCEVTDAGNLRAELFRARALGDGVRHRKLLTFALNFLDMKPTRSDVEAVERSLTQLSSTCDVEALTGLLARVRTVAPRPRRRSRRAESGRGGRRSNR